MSSRHDRHEPTMRRPTVTGVTTVVSVPRPTRGEAATILSFPTLLLVVHFTLQPLLDAWQRFGYVRYPVARGAAPEQLAPAPLTAHAWWWHEVTRLSHALVHSPGGFHSHALGNAAFILVAASVLFVLLALIGQRHRFGLIYWELVVVAPIVGSFSFDLFGTTVHGYGASTVCFAFLGSITVVALFTLFRAFSTGTGQQHTPIRFDGGPSAAPSLVVPILFVAVAIVGLDVVRASAAMPVHQAGVGFGLLVGTALLSCCDRA